VAFPDTVAVPTVVPPLVQLVGAVACGPKTVNVTVPVAPLDAPDSVELIELAAMAVPAVPLVGAEAVSAVVFLTSVELIPAPQTLAEEALPESPP
jgi:hypothetical protein